MSAKNAQEEYSLNSSWQSTGSTAAHMLLTDLVEVMNDLQTEDYHALLVFKTSQVPMHPHIYTNPPIRPPLCHLQVASSALPGSCSHMMAWVLQQGSDADHCNAHRESSNVQSKRETDDCNAHGDVSNVHGTRDKKVNVSYMTTV